MMVLRTLIFAFFIAWLTPAPALRAAGLTNQFEADIQAFAVSDRTNPPPKKSLLFLGSSSIRLWKSLSQDFAEYQPLNRGFGGSQIVDAIRYADRIVIPYEPKMIVFYSGGNDINAGKSAESVLADFQRFAQTVHRSLPQTRIAYISSAPNPARWSQVDRVREANCLIENFAASDARLSFINVFPRMLGPDGKPRQELFVEDKLHTNAEGYKLWQEIVRQHLERHWPG